MAAAYLRITNLAGRCAKAAAWALIVFAALIAGGCKQESSKFRDVQIGGETFHMELALTSEEWAQGLMGRSAVGVNDGMLFVFPDSDVRSFWMKDCLIPLDILFLDGVGRIVSLAAMEVPKPGVKPPSYSSGWEARFAVELKAGTIERLKLHVGDKVGMPLDELKRLVQ